VLDVLLINPHYVRRHGGGVVPPIGLCYLAAALREAGAEVAILDLAERYRDYEWADDDKPLNDVARMLDSIPGGPSLIGIGPLVTATLETTTAIARVVRASCGPDARIALGGPLCAVPGAASALARAIDYDLVVGGDGERPVVSAWRREAHTAVVAPGTLDPLPWREPNLDLLSVPARDLIAPGKYDASLRRSLAGGRMTSAFLSRGCPYSCAFCAAPLSSGKKVRRFSMPRVRAELDACAEYGFTEIVFYDDCLFVRSRKLDERVSEFADAIAASNWSGAFQLELRCDAVTSMSAETLARLRDAGCRQINMGIEKGHVAALDAIRKKLTPETAEIATQRVVEAGIRAAGTFILGGAGEGPDDVEATIAFAEGLDLDFAHFNPLALYPGTELFRRAFPHDADWVTLCRDRDLAPFGDILWRSDELPLRTILDAVASAYERFYDARRLARVTARAPADERDHLAQSYAQLGRERGRSWDVRSDTPARTAA
jgi:anaerobic magnesium-protoporphyrin IX monomethyl ester cyclase